MSSSRLTAVVLGIAFLAACSGESLSPASHPAASHGRDAQATFTIKWTNSKATASIRHRDTISPSAQSIAVAVNGKVTTVANRTASPTQTISLDAPVGNDVFDFSVYDLPEAKGHLLGYATVTQQIVDGAANAVSATIQTACSQTNIGYANDDPLIFVKNGASGGFANTVQGVVLAGQSPATLIVEPEDVDGDVIIAPTGPTLLPTISGSATVTAVDSAHVQLTPKTGPRSLTPDTLTVAAPGCPPTTVAVQHSPAIYAENSNGTVTIFDWYGDTIGAGSLGGNRLAGYDAQTRKMIVYDPTFGTVYRFSLDLSSALGFYSVPGTPTAWSNYLNSVVFLTYTAQSTTHFTTPTMSSAYTTTGRAFAISASTLSSDTYAYSTSGGSIGAVDLQFLGSPLLTFSIGSPQVTAIAYDAHNATLYAFDGVAGVYVTPFSKLLQPSVAATTYGFTGAPTSGAVDTDDDNLYAILSGGTVEAVSSNGPALSGFTPFNIGSTTNGSTIVVLSTNEH